MAYVKCSCVSLNSFCHTDNYNMSRPWHSVQILNVHSKSDDSQVLLSDVVKISSI